MRSIKKCLFRDYIPRDLNSAKSYNCQGNCKLSYGMGLGGEFELLIEIVNPVPTGTLEF
jgi:hypothetical protein